VFEEGSEQKQPTNQLGQLLLDLTNIPAYTHSDQDIHESSTSPIEGISKHEDIVKKFREEKQLARRQEQLLTPIESNFSISNKNDREGTLSENQYIQTGKIASSNSPYDDDLDECDQEYSPDVLFDPNLRQKAVLEDSSGNFFNSWQPQLEALKERELLGYHVRVPTESPMNGEEMIDPIIRQSFICPDCGRQTNSKKQLYRHAAQVHFSSQLLSSYETQVVESGGKCPFCEQELNMASDQRNTIIVCHMGGLHEKIFDYMTDAQRQAFCYSHRVRLVYSNAADQRAGMDKKSEE
jgi:hypothetical protein